MIVQDLNFDQTVAMAKAKAKSMIQNVSGYPKKRDWTKHF